MKNIQDLRNHLFDTIEGLRGKTLDLDRAKAIADVAQVIINSAKVEVDMVRATDGRSGSGFIELEQQPNKPRLVNGAAMSGGK